MNASIRRGSRRAKGLALLLCPSVLLPTLLFAVPAYAGVKDPDFPARKKAARAVVRGKLEVPEVPTRTDENGDKVNKALKDVDKAIKGWTKTIGAFARTKDSRVFKEMVSLLKRCEKTIAEAREAYHEVHRHYDAAFRTRMHQVEVFYRENNRFPQSIRSDLKATMNSLGPKSQRLGKVWNGYLRVRAAIHKGLRTNLDLMGEGLAIAAAFSGSSAVTPIRMRSLWVRLSDDESVAASTLSNRLANTCSRAERRSPSSVATASATDALLTRPTNVLRRAVAGVSSARVCSLSSSVATLTTRAMTTSLLAT